MTVGLLYNLSFEYFAMDTGISLVDKTFLVEETKEFFRRNNLSRYLK